MIDLYTWKTPNGRKVSVMLEECGLRYNTHAIDIGKDEQFTPQFLALNPNGKIPALADSDGPDGKPITLFESGAILVYLAGKTGKFLPAADRDKYLGDEGTHADAAARPCGGQCWGQDLRHRRLQPPHRFRCRHRAGVQPQHQQMDHESTHAHGARGFGGGRWQ